MKNVFLTDNKIGGYKLPADFQCLTNTFLNQLIDCSFEDRISKIYSKISGNAFNGSLNALKQAKFPASVVCVDDTFSILELFDGLNANYTDYFYGFDSLISKIYAMASNIISAYVDLVVSGVISIGDKINVATNADDGLLLLACHYCKLVNLPLDVIISGTLKPIDSIIKGVSIQTINQTEIDYLIGAFFDETDYVLDPDTACAFASVDLYYDDYEDDNVTLILGLSSPFLNARRVLKCLTNKNEISVDKAIEKLSEFTALEVEEPILSRKIQPFFTINSELSVFDAIELIKSTF